LNGFADRQAIPANRYDVVWVFEQSATLGGWTFSQVPQMLLFGDLPTPISD
jgi:hypothetical protein